MPPLTDDQYANREQQYNDNLGLIIGRFCTAIVEADALAKDAHLLRVLALIDKPNAEFETDTTLIGSKEPMQTRISAPVLAITQTNPIEIEEANLSLDMSVSATSQDTQQMAAEAEGQGSAKIGVGPFSVGIQVSAHMSVSSESKRSSDYRSTTHADVKMRQGQTPEGLSLILDAMHETVSTTLKINEAIMKSKLGAITEAAVTAGAKDLPPPTPTPPPKPPMKK